MGCMQHYARHHKQTRAHEKHKDVQFDITLEHEQTLKQLIYFIRNVTTGVACIHMPCYDPVSNNTDQAQQTDPNLHIRSTRSEADILHATKQLPT